MAVGCLTRAQILTGYKGQIINNIDGSLTVYLPNLQTGVQTPQLLTKPCCEALNTIDSPTYFDIETQQCRYKINDATSSAVNIVLNPKGGDGEWFTVAQDETCTLSIDFDYLFKFSCNDLKPLISNSNGIINMLENISASMILDIKVDSTTYSNVFEEPVFTAIGTGSGYTYFSGVTNNSGFYLCGGLVNEETDCLPLNLYSLKQPNGILDCSDVQHQLINGLFGESGLPSSGLTSFKNVISEDAFASNWLHFHTEITDPAILSAITNQKIVLTLRVSGVSTNISVLFDNIQLNKYCTKVDNNNIFVTKSPSFDLDKLRDNKKSWATKNIEDHRQFYIGRSDDSNQIRETDYFVRFDDRQVINSKEIELDIDIAAAVETDVWCYISDNPCILTGLTVGTTTCVSEIHAQVYTAQTITGVTCGPTTSDTYCCSDSCGDKPIDINNLLTQPLSAVTTIEDFEYYLTSELIDAKNRQSITSYPTLRLLYDRYMRSSGCSTKSSGFDYFTMDKFGKLIGNYWVDLVEQVIPATTIWGSTKIYTNTIFDTQKYKYKSYTSLFGVNLNDQKVLSPTIGDDCTVDITTTVIKGQSTDTLEFFNEGNEHKYNNIYLIQMNSSPEYIGNVNITSVQTPQVILECTLVASIPTYTLPDYGVNNGTATAIGINAQSPVSYLWSNGQTTKVATGLSGGTYSVTITDSVCSSVASITIIACTVGVTFNVIEPNYLTNNGSITATTINAQGPVSYLWNNGNTTNILTGLTSSTYTLTVTDSVCSHTQSVTLNDITNFAWRPYDTSCERETTFTIRKIITGSSSPSAVFYDTGFTPSRVWVADIDDYVRGNIYWFDPITATTEADMHYIAGLSADSLYNRYDDEVYRRLYFVGTNTVGGTTPITGLVVYDIGLNKLYQIPYGSSAQYYRVPLFVNDTNIYVVDKSTSPVTIKSVSRATLTSASTFTTIVSDDGFNEQVQFTQVGDKIWTLMYADTNHARINVFDNNFNHLNININGTISSNYLISSVSFGSGVLRTGMFYDKDYDTIYVSDIGTNSKIIITGASTMHYTGGTATTYVMTNYIINGKSNIQISWSIDPVSNRLYENHSYLNSISDTSEIYAAYEIDRATNQYKKMFNFEINNVKPVNDGLSDSLMTSNPNVVWWNNHSTSAWNNDGTITFYNNSISGGTTGLVDILTTEKYDTYTNKSYIPSTILPNISGNTNYVTSPVFTLTGDCAVHYTYQCPLVKWTSGTVPTFELYLDASVALNPNLSKILVSGYYTGSPVSNRVILSGASGFNQYYMSTLTGGSTNIDSVHVTYYSGGPVTYTQVSACTLSNFS